MGLKKPFAIFTICKNEPLFLPIWFNYYRQFVPLDDMYVLDHQSDDGSTTNLECNRIVVENELAFDHAWVTNTVKDMQRRLLDHYEVVLFTEIDEIVFAKEGLDKYAREYKHNAIKCQGYDLIHMPVETPLMLGRPILEQRKYWYFSPTFQCKPYLAKVPLDWSYGYHGAHGVSEMADDLFLIHLNRMDYGLAYERNLSRQKFKMHQGDKAAGYGYQKHLQGEEFANWFYNDLRGEQIVEIPQWVKELQLV